MTSIHILHSLLAQPAAPSLSGAGFKCRRGNWGAWLLPSRTGKPALWWTGHGAEYLGFLPHSPEPALPDDRSQDPGGSGFLPGGAPLGAGERSCFPTEVASRGHRPRRREAELPKCMERRVRGEEVLR